MPEPTVITTLKLPKSLHHAAKILAVTDDISLNQFIVDAVKEAVPAPKKK